MTGDYLFFPIAVFLLLYFYFTRNNNYWKNKNVPFLKPLPFFGNVIDGIMMRLSMGELFHKFHQEAKTPVLGLFVLDKPCLLIKDLSIIKRVLVHDFQSFYDRSILMNKRDDPVCAHVLFILKNPEWKEIRSKVSPFFTTKKMKLMSTLTEEVSNEMIGYLKEKIKSNPVVDMKEVCVKFTVDVITSAAFGVTPDAFRNENSRFCIEAKKIINWDNFVTSFRMRCYFLGHTLVKIFRMKFMDPVAIKFLEESFTNILKTRARAQTNNRNDLIDIFLKQDKNDEFSIEQEKLVSQAIMFFVAGFETTSSALGFGLYELAHNTEIQTKLREEVYQISEKHGGINYESLKEMEYLDMCVKEILRKYPVLPFVERMCNADYRIPETGAVIDKGTSIFISVLALHHDPKYFPDPEVFDPERFSQENKHNIQNFSYMPFGEGPRNCIGARFGLLTMKFGLAHMLKNFVIESSTGSFEKIKYNPNGVPLSALQGIKIKLRDT